MFKYYKYYVNRMVKKLKQGQKYPEGFTQMQILLKLCENDQTPTSDILDFLKESFYIREQKNVREHHLKTLEKHRLIRRKSAGRGHPDYWSVIPDFKVLKEILKRVKDYPRAQHDFMKSKYYRSWIPELVDSFNKSFAEIGLTTIDVTRAAEDVERIKKDTSCGRMAQLQQERIKDLKHAIESGKLDEDVAAELKKRLVEEESYNPDMPYTFSDTELEDITKALEYNWTVLQFIVHYLSTDDETKRKLMITLAADSRLGTPSGAKVTATGWMALHITNFIMTNDLQISGDVPDEYQHFLDMGVDRTIADSMLRYATKKTIKQLTGRDVDDLPTMWFAEWFAELDMIRHRYPFLFD